ncbi:TetR/AcrR family transcriptional regulator [Novosphingobium lentum]|uniref:TetR/AcrR family transcriptional regulator n=1 Tax=Novosphingobium lentum TaxID=145287 RepID=UPI000833ACEB|nr:TetR/AcrR family transcriptional regulator [Novosphingobium lentum]
MPAIVDHVARRRQVTRIAARLIAQSGTAATTIRAIAREAGCSTAIVSHYFRDKRELTLATYRLAMEETIELARRRRARGADLATCLEAIMPLDRRRRDNWKVWFAFWGVAMADPEFMAEQRLRGREARALFAELIAAQAGLEDAALRETQARRLLVVVSGLATQATYDPAEWPPHRQRELIAAEVEALGLARAPCAACGEPAIDGDRDCAAS